MSDNNEINLEEIVIPVYYFDTDDKNIIDKNRMRDHLEREMEKLTHYLSFFE